MNNHYDENLQENPFLQLILNDYKDVIENAVNKSWLICVPRLHSFNGKALTQQDVYEHVLVPLECEEGFETLSKHKIVVYDKRVILDDGVSSVGILFDETVYANSDTKYKLLCIEHPLNQVSVNDELVCIRSVRDCVQLLWTVLDDFNKVIESAFVDGFNSVQLDALKAKYLSLFKKCNRLASKKSRADVEKYGAKNVTLAVETYLQHCICSNLVGAISSASAHSEGCFNKIIRNNSQVQLKDLDISNSCFENILGAKRELYGINKFSTALGKIGCLNRTVSSLSSQKQIATADDLLKIFIFLILKSNINNWITNLTFINHFRLSALNLCEENSFLITTLEAAIEYIKIASFAFEEYKVEATSLKCLTDLFNAIRADNLALISEHFTTRRVLIDSSSCHPLCSCDKCETSGQFTLNSCDDNGNNALHVSALHGRVGVVEYLINKRVDLTQPNNSESLPIHCAASKGHQNALLLLLHSNSPIEAKDCDGNTPLHLAANNGHENCVKALLYFAEQKGYEIDANCRNNLGETALHFAAKWSYVAIVKILLEYGGEAQTCNNFNQTVYDVAHNDAIRKLLTDHSPVQVRLLNPAHFQPSPTGIKPKNVKQTKKMELIQRAIESNDLPLMCFHLGIPALELTPKLPDFEMCHPLCVCEKCKRFDSLAEIATSKPPSSEVVNLNTCNSDGYTSLHVASKCGFVEIVRLLLDSGALINVRTYVARYTPLHLACMHRHLRVVQELLKCGNCDTNEIDVDGNTPLHYACLNDDSEIIDSLLRRCGNCNVKNKEGKTAMQLTKQKRGSYS